MANGDQIKAMLRAYKEDDEKQLVTVALQIAAKEAKAGHVNLAAEIRDLADQLKSKRNLVVTKRSPTPIIQPKGELADLMSATYPEVQLSELVLASDAKRRLERIICEQRQSAKIKEHGLEPRRKLLLVGAPGTGKTMSASVLATELSLPLFTLRLENLFTRYMGEAAAKLRLIFDNIQQVRGIYLFDEFDAIGQQRATANDIGEVRRILSSFLQMVEQDQSNSVVVAATNHPELLDSALFRRFDDVLHYGLPQQDALIELYQRRLKRISLTLDYEKIAEKSIGLSFADAQCVCDNALKTMIVSGATSLSSSDILESISERFADKKTFSNRL